MLDFLNNTLYGDVTWLNLITAVLIFFFALIMSKFLTIQIRRSLKERLSKEHLELFTKLLTYGILLVAAMWIMTNIGVELSGLLVAGGIAGLAIGFASQSIIGNLISGLFLMVERPVKIGDLINIAGEYGIVEDIQIIATFIRTLEGNTVRIPNETVFTSSITNYTNTPVRRFEYDVGINYADDADKAVQIIKDIVSDHPLALLNPPPQIYVEELGDSSVDIKVRIWAPNAVWWKLKMELLWKIKTSIEAEGIEIPFPQRVLWQGDAQKEKQ